MVLATARRSHSKRHNPVAKGDGTIFLMIPGTSCLTTIVLSLRDAQGFSLGKVRRLALPKQDRIMLPAGLDVLGRPKGENRIAHGLQPWDSMAFQKLTKLFLIRKFAVMLGLIGNVGGNGLYARLAD